MATCGDRELTEGVLYDCLTDVMKKGIEDSNAVIINWKDIDRSASTENGAVISDLVLLSGKAGLPFQFPNDLADAGGTLARNAEQIDGFTNSFKSRMVTTTSEHAERCAELKGGLFVVVYKSKFKGTNGKDQFKVRGWDQGLILSELTENTNENGGNIMFTLTSDEEEVERYPYMTFYETDAATSQATYDSLFATV